VDQHDGVVEPALEHEQLPVQVSLEVSRSSLEEKLFSSILLKALFPQVRPCPTPSC
jgi:hypothetical protein